MNKVPMTVSGEAAQLIAAAFAAKRSTLTPDSDSEQGACR